MEEQSFGVWLEEQIQESDMTVKEAAEQAGPRPLLYFYLTDKRLPVPESARKLAEALESDAEEVVQFARKNIGSPQKSRAHNPQRNVPLTRRASTKIRGFAANNEVGDMDRPYSDYLFTVLKEQPMFWAKKYSVLS